VGIDLDPRTGAGRRTTIELERAGSQFLNYINGFSTSGTRRNRIFDRLENLKVLTASTTLVVIKRHIGPFSEKTRIVPYLKSLVKLYF
jgi:hypothetical protein